MRWRYTASRIDTSTVTLNLSEYDWLKSKFRKFLLPGVQSNKTGTMLAVPSSSVQPMTDKDDDVEWVKVPVVFVERSSDEEHEAELHEIFFQSNEQLRRHTADWQQSVRRMRDNFIRLHPVDDDDDHRCNRRF